MKGNYGRAFYRTVAGNATQSSAVIVPIIMDLIAPTSVVDVGCGPGGWLAEFRRHGIVNVLGIDGPWVDPAILEIPNHQFRVADLSKPLENSERFDLVLSLETAEHLPPSAASTFVESLTSLGSLIVFSAAIPYQGGTNHLNEQWPDYWADLFAARGYGFIDCIRPRIWNRPNVEWWYAQNIFVVAKLTVLDNFPNLRDFRQADHLSHLSVVHPRAYLENVARAKTAAQLFQASLGSVKRSLLGKRSTE